MNQLPGKNEREIRSCTILYRDAGYLFENFQFHKHFSSSSLRTRPASAPHLLSLSMKRVLSYSAEAKRAAVRVYYAMQDEAEANPDLSKYAFKMAIAASGGASEQSIRNWLKEDLSQEAIDDRLGHRGRPRVLSSDQEHILIGFFIDKRLNLDPVSRQDLTDFARRYFSLEIYPQRISEILSKNGITLQASRPRESRMVSPEVVDDALSSSPM